MNSISRLSAAVLVMTSVVAAAAAAQESRPASQPKVQVPLKIQLVLSRTQADKKISSIPYSLYVTTNEGRTSLRMSVQVPVASTQFGANSPVASYSLKDIGTNIDCAAEPGTEPGVFKISLTVTDTTALPMAAILAARGGDGQLPTGMPSVAFRNFTSTFNILLKDGQTAQYTSATDPVNGEVLKIDATLNVLK